MSDEEGWGKAFSQEHIRAWGLFIVANARVQCKPLDPIQTAPYVIYVPQDVYESWKLLRILRLGVM